MIDRHQMTARYKNSRANFLNAMQQAGGEVIGYRHPLAGPSTEPLFLDLGILGNKHAQKLIIIASGTHGIEGYLGSELQTRLLKSSIFKHFLQNTLLIFIHAVNPFGMAWHRRVNENNVDLNRNFLAFDQALPHNHDYDLLKAVVNPARLEAQDIDAAEKKMMEFLQQHGLMQYVKALSGGQYHYPEGVQYGGQQPEWSNTQLNAIWEQYVSGKQWVLNLDLHSGLGSRGEGLIMLHGDEEENRIKRVKACWQGLMISPGSDSDDFIMFGVLGHYLEKKFPSIEVIAAVLEFGTVEMQQVAKAMIADNWLHRFGDIDSEKGQQIKQQLFDAFYIDDDSYRHQIYTRAEEVVVAALKLSI